MSDGLTVAVTGASGTVGRELVRLLEADERVARVIATARRPRDPSELGWRATPLVTADVRDPAAIARVLAGADVVVHAAFAIYGGRMGHAALRAVNVDGSLNVGRAAVAAGARRFVYLSSVAVYGLHPGNPQPLTEDDAVRPTGTHYYFDQKAEVEPLVRSLLEEAGIATWLLRPCGIVGPHAAGAALDPVPQPAVRAGRRALRAAARIGLRPPVVAPAVALQFVHAADVARAAQLAVHGEGEPDAYNLAGDGVLAGEEVPRVLGLRTLPLPRAVRRPVFRAVGRLQAVHPALAWPQAFAEPLIVDTSRAKQLLGWRPRFSTRAALEATRPGLGL